MFSCQVAEVDCGDNGSFAKQNKSFCSDGWKLCQWVSVTFSWSKSVEMFIPLDVNEPVEKLLSALW